ncbi:MAG: hypothetical protein ACK4WH_09980, partial [Phycisphaerales bacterium]
TVMVEVEQGAIPFQREPFPVTLVRAVVSRPWRDRTGYRQSELPGEQTANMGNQSGKECAV